MSIHNVIFCVTHNIWPVADRLQPCLYKLPTAAPARYDCDSQQAAVPVLYSPYLALAKPHSFS